jgi:hypothetical protein
MWRSIKVSTYILNVTYFRMKPFKTKITNPNLLIAYKLNKTNQLYITIQ